MTMRKIYIGVPIIEIVILFALSAINRKNIILKNNTIMIAFAKDA